jgi:hypothetical protein
LKKLFFRGLSGRRERLFNAEAAENAERLLG